MAAPSHRHPQQPSPLYTRGGSLPANEVTRRSLGNASGLSSFCSFNLAYPVENEAVGYPAHSFPKNYDNSLYNVDRDVQTPMNKLLGPKPTLSGRTYQQVRFAASGDLFRSCEDLEVDGGETSCSPPHGNIPMWNKSRPYLTGHHQWLDQAEELVESKKVGEHSSSMQEGIILEDLLYGFMGLGGQYLQFRVEESVQKKRDIRCVLGVELDTSLHQKVSKVLSVCEDVVIMQRFIETRLPFESGVVSHAVASAMRNVLDDWMLMVTQLEALFRRGKLTMQSLWYYIQAPLGTLQIVAGIARKAAAASLGGPGLLQLIYKTLEDYTGNRNAQVLLQRLLATACAPYFEMLEKWLCEGIVDDPYEEFMISEKLGILQKSMTENLESKYWHERYTIRSSDEEEIGWPMFLDQYKTMILKTGKYLNAIRECGLTVHRPLDRDERVVYDSSRAYAALIHKAHKESSRAFLQLFMQDLRLLSWLRGLKHFFLHDRGDMISQLMDIADEEFRKTPDQVSHTRLQSLMELAVRTSSVPAHTNSEPLAFEFDPLSLVEMAKGIFDRRKMHSCFRSSMQSSIRGSTRITKTDEDSTRLNRRNCELITGFDVFMITYRVDWPMTLIVPEKLMLRYKLLFKHLFLLKRSERELGSAWHILQFSRRLMDRHAEVAIQRTCLLCHKFMHTIQMYFRFITVEILEPEWNILEAEISRAEDVDRVIEVHRLFVSRVLRHSLLRKLKVITQLEGIEHDALRFSNLVKRSIRVDEVLETPARIAHARKQRQNWHRELQNHAIAEDFSNKEFQASLAKLESGYQEKLDSLVFHMKAAYDASSNNKQEPDFEGPKETREDLDCLMNLIERLGSRG